MIHIDNLHKRFGEIQAVDGVSFDVARGQVFGLLGPNGAGKTTTINMLVGVLKPDAGTVEINGEGAPTCPSIRARIGNAPQALAIYDELTPEENLRFFGRLYGLCGARLKTRVAECLEFVGLTDRRKSRVSSLSGGMKRRLNLACGIVHEPPVLLLDEPTVGVDPQSRNLIFEKIEQLRDTDVCIVYTTHYMEEAQRLCDRVAIIDHGKILAEGTVSELLDRYGDRAVVTAELERAPDGIVSWPGPLEGLSLRFESDHPMEDIAALSNQGVSFRSLHVERADLEGVFLNLTGRRLRD